MIAIFKISAKIHIYRTSLKSCIIQSVNYLLEQDVTGIEAGYV